MKKRNEQKRTTKTINKMAVSTYLSIITLNINELNAPIKRHSMAEGIQMQNLYAYKRLTSDLKTQTESEGMERSIP